MAGFSFLLLLNGCASLQPPALQPTLPRQVELGQTPFFPQETHQCGPAALATVLNFRGLSLTPEELTPQVFLPQRKGSLQVEMIATARRYGMLAYPLAPRLNDLMSELAAGNPVLVLQNLAFNWWPRWHYAVVIGYDLETGEVFLRSGRERRWRSDIATFNRTWDRAGSWAMVILPPHQVPATAELLTYLRAVLDLEQSGHAQAAQTGYHSASRRWSHDARAWLALGNHTYGLGKNREAIAAFTTATDLDPKNPSIWNNLAYAYLQGQCPEQAVNAIEMAIELAPADTNLQQSYQEIHNRAPRLDPANCSLKH